MTTHRDNVMPEVENFIYATFDFSKNSKIKVLELGASHTEDFKNKFKEFDWLCTDITDGIRMEDLSKFKDNEFDLVFSCHAFEHCERPIDALREMKRVASKFVYIITPHACYHHILGADDDHIFVLSQDQMERLFMYIKFKDLSVYTQCPKHLKKQDWNLISIGEVK